MATKLFLRDSASDLTIGAATNKALLLQQGAAKVASDNTATTGGPTAGLQVKKSSVVLTWFSNPLKAITISGTVTFNLWGIESASQANTGFDVLVERCDQAGNVISTIARSEKGTELPTAVPLAQNWTATPTSTTLAEGDRIKVTVFGNDAGGNMGNSRTFTLDYGAGTVVDGDSYVQFNETITEGAAATESGAGTDNAAAAAEISATETGAGADQLAIAVEIVLNETGAGTDAVDVVDNGSGDQDLEAGDSGAGTDGAAASADVTLTETAPGSDQLAIAATVDAAESGAGTDTSNVSADATLAETTPGADQLAIAVEIPLGESAPGSDAVFISVSISVNEEAPGTDGAGQEDAPTGSVVGETGAGTDASIATADHTLGESAPGRDRCFATWSSPFFPPGRRRRKN